MNVKQLSSVCLALTTGLALVGAPHRALAQRPPYLDAGSKIRGDAYWPSRAASRHVETAKSYARDVQTYVAKASQPEPSVVKDIKSDLGRYLEDAQRHLATMKKDFAEDKETAAAVERIEKGLTTAVEHYKAVIACCENEKFDQLATMACCADLVKQLDKVHAEHVALMKKLSQKYAVPAKR